MAAQLPELMKAVLDLQKEHPQTVEACTQTKQPFPELRNSCPAVLHGIVVSEGVFPNKASGSTSEKHTPISLLERRLESDFRSMPGPIQTISQQPRNYYHDV